VKNEISCVACFNAREKFQKENLKNQKSIDFFAIIIYEGQCQKMPYMHLSTDFTAKQLELQHWFPVRPGPSRLSSECQHCDYWEEQCGVGQFLVSAFYCSANDKWLHWSINGWTALVDLWLK